MRKILVIMLTISMVFGLAACGSSTSGKIGDQIEASFKAVMKETPNVPTEEIAGKVTADISLPFSTMTQRVDEGILAGLGNAEITGFNEAAMFCPLIGSIPFLGYIFALKDDTDVDAFIQTLKDNADLAWNICTEAEDLNITSVGSTVFFLMSKNDYDDDTSGLSVDSSTSGAIEDSSATGSTEDSSTTESADNSSTTASTEDSSTTESTDNSSTETE
jgi:hypothetical protein